MIKEAELTPQDKEELDKLARRTWEVQHGDNSGLASPQAHKFMDEFKRDFLTNRTIEDMPMVRRLNKSQDRPLNFTPVDKGRGR